MSKRKQSSPLAHWRTELSKKTFGAPTRAASDVRFIRETLNMTQQSLAEYLGTYQATIARWEAGTHVPRGGYLIALNVLYKQALKRLREQHHGWRQSRRRT